MQITTTEDKIVLKHLDRMFGLIKIRTPMMQNLGLVNMNYNHAFSSKSKLVKTSISLSNNSQFSLYLK